MDVNFSDNDSLDDYFIEDSSSGTSRRARSLSPSRNDRYSKRAGWRHASTDWDRNPNSFGEKGDPGWKRQRVRDMKNLKRRGVGIHRLRAAVARSERRQGRNGHDLYNFFRRFDQFEEGWVSRRNFGR